MTPATMPTTMPTDMLLLLFSVGGIKSARRKRSEDRYADGMDAFGQMMAQRQTKSNH